MGEWCSTCDGTGALHACGCNQHGQTTGKTCNRESRVAIVTCRACHGTGRKRKATRDGA